jgi:hypothetical protein
LEGLCEGESTGGLNVGVGVKTLEGLCEGESTGGLKVGAGAKTLEGLCEGESIGAFVAGVLVCAVFGAATGTWVVITFGAVDSVGTGAVVLTPVQTGMEHAKSTQNLLQATSQQKGLISHTAASQLDSSQPGPCVSKQLPPGGAHEFDVSDWMQASSLHALPAQISFQVTQQHHGSVSQTADSQVDSSHPGAI